MARLHPILFFAVLICAALPVPAADKSDPPKDSRPNTDFYGDPMPDGVVARLGTTRLRSGSGVYALAFTADGKTFVSAGGDKMVHLWSVASGQEYAQCQGHKGAATAVFLLPGDRKMVSAGADGTLRLWDTENGRELASGEAKTPRLANRIVLTADGKTFVTTDAEGGVRTWDADSLKLTNTYPTLDQHLPVVPSPDGGLFACYGKDKAIHLFATATGKEELNWATKFGGTALAFSADGKKLAASGRIGNTATIVLFDAANGKELQSFLPNLVGVTVMAFSPNGKFLVGGGGQLVTVWDVESGKELRQFKLTWGARALAFNADGSVLAIGGTDQCIHLWDMKANKKLFVGRGHEAAVGPIQFSPDGKTVLTNCWDQTIRSWDAKTGKELRRAAWPTPFGGNVLLAPDCRKIASGANGSFVFLHELTDDGLKEAYRITAPASVSFGAYTVSSDWKSVATACHNGPLTVLDLAAKKARWELPPTPDVHIRTLAFSPDDAVLATLSQRLGRDYRQSIQLLDTTTGKHLAEIDQPTDLVRLVFSPDGYTLISFGRELQFWETASGQQRLRVEKLPAFAESAAFTRDGQLLAIGFGDGSIQLYSPRDGVMIARLTGHQADVQALAFSSDGTLMASGSTDTTALVWDVAEYLKKATPTLANRTKAELDALWKDVIAADAVKANVAVRSLAATSGPTAANVADHIRGLAPDPKRIKQLIAALDDDSFNVREKATDDLAALGELAADAVQKALADKPTVEAKNRLETVVERHGKMNPIKQTIPLRRGLEVLEALATTEAKQELDKLAKDYAETQLGQQAKAAAERLARRLVAP